MVRPRGADKTTLTRREITEGAITRLHHNRSNPPCYQVDFPVKADLHDGETIGVLLTDINHHKDPQIEISPAAATTARSATATATAEQARTDR